MENLKNLLVYISPTKAFVGLYGALTKIQVDNSLSLGWKKEDIIIVTNFPWEYIGVKTIVVGDKHFYAARPRSIKTAIIPFLIDEGIMEKGKIYWNHDLDAFQLNVFKKREIGLTGFDAGLTDYGWRPRWCLGSFFVKVNSKDIFEKARKLIYKNIEDETALVELTQKPSIGKRCKRLNVTYNFGMRNIGSNWEKAIKPLKVVHFAPYSKRMPTLDMFMYGKNELNMPLIDKRLKRILNYHRIK
jgi:hypothetical protein